jgi:hypothetical protein
LEEFGGLSLYAFVGNVPVSKVDSFGLEIVGHNYTQKQLVRTVTGYTIKGEKVGTFQYPRKGQCGCWERGVYADFTPTLKIPYYHFDETTVYKDEINPLGSQAEFLLELAGAAATEGESLESLLLELGLEKGVGAVALDLKYYLISTVKKEGNIIDGDLSKTYYKKGESWKISSETCKPKLTLLDVKAIEASLTPSFPGNTFDFLYIKQTLVSAKLEVDIN